MYPIDSLETDFKKYGDIFTVRSSIFGAEVVITQPESLKQVFTGNPAVFDAAEANTVFGPLLGERSLLLLQGDAHLRQRRLILPAFHGERVARYTETMRDMTARMTVGFRPGERVKLYPVMQRITLEVMLRNVLGLDEGPELEELRDKLTNVLDRIQSRLGALWMTPGVRGRAGWFPPVRSFFQGVEDARALIAKHIERRRAEGSEGRRDDVLAMLLEAEDESGAKLTDEEVRDAIVTLIVAGHETTAISLCWAFEEILSSPDEQSRLGTEIEDVLAGEPLTAAHLPNLKRLDAAVREVLRLHPVTGAVGRRLKEPVTIQGYEIPAGVLLVLCFHLTHRIPELYPDPAVFKPERFLDKKPDTYAWLPFGGGDRRCIGMAFALHEMKVVIATMLQRFRLRLERPGPAKSALRGLFYVPKGGTTVVVESDLAAPVVVG
jgi:cytochrome P450